MFRLPLLLMLLASFAWPATAAPGFDPYAGPRPIAVFVLTEPQLLVAGSDMPRAAVYDNGEIIFSRAVDGGIVYRRAVLDQGQMADLRTRLAALARNKALASAYDLRPGAEGIPEARFFLVAGTRQIAIAVRGWGERTPDPKILRVLPLELRRLHEWFDGLAPAHATAWQARYIEVMFWPNPDATDPSIDWPVEWPSLRSSRAVARGQLVSIYLDGQMLPALRDFLATQKPRGAVAIGGRKMAVDFRLAFPSEPLWRRAFAALPVAAPTP